jgi:peptide-methionine (S)-S-oxide reductase
MYYLKAIFCLCLFSTIACSQKQSVPDTQNENISYPALDHKVVSISDYEHIPPNAVELKVATLAGGCFWCTEAAFERIEGIIDVISGYSGGAEQYPTYRKVANKMTSHAEAIHIYYDEQKISFKEILDVFFVAHDPTQLNRQGPDVGPQYRSEIFFHNDEQKMASESSIQNLNESGKFKSPIVTKITAFEEFWVAEGYHQNYYELNPNQGYVRAVSKPKVEKVLKAFPDKIKKIFK